MNSESKRVIRIVIELTGGVKEEDIMFLGWTSDDKFPLDKPLIHEIEFIPRKSEGSFSGTFSFCGRNTPPFASAKLRASLFIGKVTNP